MGSKWNMSITEKDDELVVKFNGSSSKAGDLLALETALRNIKAWSQDIDFKDGKTPQKITKTWFVPLKSVKPKLNPTKSKGGKSVGNEVNDDALKFYEMVNKTEPSEINHEEVWVPREGDALVAIGEGPCPFIGYMSSKISEDGKMDTFIHHFGEEGDEQPRLYVTMPPPGYKRMMIIYGGDWGIEDRDGTWWLVR